jgi:hypothetical protein
VSVSPGYLGLSHPHAQSQGAAAAAPEGPLAWLGDMAGICPAVFHRQSANKNHNWLYYG